MTQEPQRRFGFPIAPPPRISTTQFIQKQLIDAIRNGELGPDAPFPTEKELCEMFNVSRGSVRDALSGLVATGLIEIQQGKRTSVRASADDEFQGLFGLYIELHKDELTELLEVRSALDGLAAAKAARNWGDHDRHELIAAHDAFAAAAREGADPTLLKDLDVAFHSAVARTSGGNLVVDLLEGLNNLLTWSREILFAREGQLPRSVEGHQQILDAILARDPEAARQRASDHAQFMWSWVEHFRSYRPEIMEEPKITEEPEIKGAPEPV